MPLWHGQMRGTCGLIKSLHLSNKVQRYSDSLEVILVERESIGKSEEIQQTEHS